MLVKTKKLKERWIAALRSGEFKQGRAALFKDGKYCCLGVLAVQAGAVPNAKGELICDGKPVGAGGFLSTEFWDACKLGELVTYQYFLANRNDEGRSFKKIAAHIRRGYAFAPVPFKVIQADE